MEDSVEKHGNQHELRNQDDDEEGEVEACLLYTSDAADE